MRLTRVRTVASLVGGAAIVAAVAVCVENPSTDNVVAGGSGDSATGTQFTSPTIPAMSINPTDMNTGATAVPVTTESTIDASLASPTMKAVKPNGF